MASPSIEPLHFVISSRLPTLRFPLLPSGFSTVHYRSLHQQLQSHQVDEQIAPRPSPRLFLHGIPSQVTAEEVASFLNNFEGVVHSHYFPSKIVPLSQAVVRFSTTELAAQALKELHGAIIPSKKALMPMHARFDRSPPALNRTPIPPSRRLVLELSGHQPAMEQLTLYLKTFEGLEFVRYHRSTHTLNHTASTKHAQSQLHIIVAALRFGTVEQATKALQVLDGGTLPGSLSSELISAHFKLPPPDPNPCLQITYMHSKNLDNTALHTFFAQFDGMLMIMNWKPLLCRATVEFNSTEHATQALHRIWKGDYKKKVGSAGPLRVTQSGYSRYWLRKQKKLATV